MRRITEFQCAGETLFGTLDDAAGKTGLLVVSGGNETRIGAHRGMALLAQRLALQGIPVFRFDRRGVGDSTGPNGGFRSASPDIAAAALHFRQMTGIERLVAFGNCDAATALALFSGTAGIDRRILANPWVIDQTDPLPPAAAIRARYLDKLRDPQEWVRLVSGGVDLGKLARGLRKLAQPAPRGADSLFAQFDDAMKDDSVRSTILLSQRDATAIAFQTEWNRHSATRTTVPIHTCNTDSHSFARPADKAWLEDLIVAVIVGG